MYVLVGLPIIINKHAYVVLFRMSSIPRKQTLLTGASRPPRRLLCGRPTSRPPLHLAAVGAGHRKARGPARKAAVVLLLLA